MGTDSPVSEVVAHARFTGIRDAMDLVDDNEGIGSPCVRDATAAPRDGRLSLLTSLGRITSGVATQSADSGRFDCGSSVGRTRLPERSIAHVGRLDGQPTRRVRNSPANYTAGPFQGSLLQTGAARP